MPKRLITWLSATAALLILIAIPLGSEGETDGDPTAGQQIANVLFPLGVLCALAAVGILVVSAVRLARQDRAAS